jgi:hypothetical protein
MKIDDRSEAVPMDIEVTEIVAGELDVTAAGRRHRVVIPAGVGVPGLEDVDLARGLVAELLAQGVAIPDVVDVSGLLRTRPELLDRIADRVEQGD